MAKHAIPTIHSVQQIENLSKKFNFSETSQDVDSCTSPTEEILNVSCDVENEVKIFINTKNEIIKSQEFELYELNQKVKSLLEEKERFNKGYIYSLDQYRKLEQKHEILNKSLDKMFNDDQKEALTRDTRGMLWSNASINKALQFKFACGGTGYNLLRENHFPLPSQRTLARRLENFKFDCGILEEVFEFLEHKVKNMTVMERQCSLVFDEMSISEGIQYDPSTEKNYGGVTFPGI